MNVGLAAGGLGLATLLALAAGAWLPLEQHAAAPAAAIAARTTSTPAPVAPWTATLPAATTSPKASPDRSRELLLPDGSSVPTLNGATDAAPLARYWGPFPWSPIVGVRRSAGVDWYEHADGSFSTTQMVWRSDLGRMAAMTRVAHPGPAAAATAPVRTY